MQIALTDTPRFYLRREPMVLHQSRMITVQLLLCRRAATQGVLLLARADVAYSRLLFNEFPTQIHLYMIPAVSATTFQLLNLMVVQMIFPRMRRPSAT